MSRNVTILIIILVVILIAGYLIWLRNKFTTTSQVATVTPTPEVTVMPTSVIPTLASPSATATPSATPKLGKNVATSSGTKQ